ncbi:hypothetical protein [Micromonospora coriariae]|uniref:hypothetical protein n=1 Tax=Micromonospora coriariae TaxID=285665 RepID=UPI0018D549CB|nr:hypothetical protein [Micromonospora coriariae]
MPLMLVHLDNTLIDRDAAFRAAVAAFLAEHGLADTDLAWIMRLDASGYTARDAVASAMADRFEDLVPQTRFAPCSTTGQPTAWCWRARARKR